MDTMANALELGSNRVDTIHYLPGYFSYKDRHTIIIKNAICICEEDEGLIRVHGDYHPGGWRDAVGFCEHALHVGALVL